MDAEETRGQWVEFVGSHSRDDVAVRLRRVPGRQGLRFRIRSIVSTSLTSGPVYGVTGFCRRTRDAGLTPELPEWGHIPG